MNDTPEKLALQTTFLMNLYAISIRQNKRVPEGTRRFLTDFLQNTCVPFQTVNEYPEYDVNRTPFIRQNYKPLSAWDRAQQLQAGTLHQSQ